MSGEITKPPFLRLRARETGLQRGEKMERIVEVLDDDQVVGQLPVTSAVYEMALDGFGKLTVSVIVAGAVVESHHA